MGELSDIDLTVPGAGVHDDRDLNDRGDFVELVIPAGKQSETAKVLVEAADDLDIPQAQINLSDGKFIVPKQLADAVAKSLPEADGDEPDLSDPVAPAPKSVAAAGPNTDGPTEPVGSTVDGDSPSTPAEHKPAHKAAAKSSPRKAPAKKAAPSKAAAKRAPAKATK